MCIATGLSENRGASVQSLKKRNCSIGQTAIGRRGCANVRKGSLLHPINLGFLAPKPCKTTKFSIQLNVFPMSPVFVTAPFLERFLLKTANSEKFVFSCQTSSVVPEPPDSLVFGRKQAPDTCRALFRFLPGRKSGPVPEFRRTLFFAGFSAARQPAKDLARDATAHRGFGL